MLFWTDGVPESTRTRNCSFAWNRFQNLEKILQNEGLDVVCRLVDHSPEKIFTTGNVTHDPYPLGTYKRSEKINKILFNSDSQFIGIMDSDAFLHENQSHAIIDMFKRMEPKNAYTFDLKDIDNWESIIDFKEHTIDIDNITYTSRFPGHCNPGLGGFFICCTDTLKSKNGFNEDFKTWGGEDGDVFSKLWDDSSIGTYKVNEINVWHIPHFCDRENSLYFNREEYMRLNNLLG